MNRREFAAGLAAAPLLPLAPGAVAQSAALAVEGRTYKRLSQGVPVAVPGKIEVIEFFGYWCPHCNDFEPKLEAWVKKLPKDVNFRRMPVAWQAAQVPYQKLYFALETMGLVDSLQQKVFDAVHKQRLHLEVDAGLAAFAAANGVDKAKLVDHMNGFTVASKLRMAGQLWSAYDLDGVPALTVNGRYVTSPATANGEDQALRVVDELIQKSRSPGT